MEKRWGGRKTEEGDETVLKSLDPSTLHLPLPDFNDNPCNGAQSSSSRRVRVRLGHRSLGLSGGIDGRSFLPLDVHGSPRLTPVGSWEVYLRTTPAEHLPLLRLCSFAPGRTCQLCATPSRKSLPTSHDSHRSSCVRRGADGRARRRDASEVPLIEADCGTPNTAEPRRASNIDHVPQWVG